MSRRGPGIQFAGNAEWGAYCQQEMARWAKTPEVSPLAVRVLFAAMGRHDRSGHAPFDRGELADVLGGVDVRTGEVVPARADSVSKAIKAAKHLGFVGDDSTVRCLILRRQEFQKASGPRVPCRIHIG